MANKRELNAAAMVVAAAMAPLAGAVTPDAGPMNFPVKRHRPGHVDTEKIVPMPPVKASDYTPPKHEPSQAKLKARKRKNAAKRKHQ